MGYYREHEKDDEQYFTEQEYDEEIVDMPDKKRVRRLLEEKLERKRLRQEIDELDGEFDWDDLEK
jgi:hypothetical protein